MEPLGQIEVSNGRASFQETVPPLSLTLFSSHKLTRHDRGLVDE
jgi:hypothetical protein